MQLDAVQLMATLRSYQNTTLRTIRQEELLGALAANLKKQHSLGLVAGEALGQVLDNEQLARATLFAYPYLPMMSPVLATAVLQGANAAQ